MSDDDELVNRLQPEARPQVVAALNERRRRAEAKQRNRWGEGLEGQRLDNYCIVVTQGRTKKRTFVFNEEEEPGTWQLMTESFRDPLGTISGPLHLSEPLPETVPLTQSFELPAKMLSIILDALASGSIHQVAVEDIQRIRPQLGSRIMRLGDLSGEQQRLAEGALYREILARCTTL